MSSIEDLSTELLVKIFKHVIESEGHVQFLKNVSPVCKKWRKISLTPPLWASVKKASWHALVTFSSRDLLYHTQTLQLPSTYGDSRPRDMSDVFPKIHKLKALELSNYVVTKKMMQFVARHCNNLESLALKNVNVDNYIFDDLDPSMCLDDVDLDDFEEHRSLKLDVLGPILNVCGSKLRHLDFSHSELEEDLLGDVFDKCPVLEEFYYCNDHWTDSEELFPEENLFPICKLANACPRLRKLVFSCVNIVTTGIDDCIGFKDIEVFKASQSNFHGFDFCSVLNNSENLEYLLLYSNQNFMFINIANIPSDKLRYLELKIENPDRNTKVLEQAVDKWKYSLVQLKLWDWKCDITSVIKTLLIDNPIPKIQSLMFARDTVDKHVLKTLVQKCEKLSNIDVSPSHSNAKTRHLKHSFKSREEVENILDFL